MEVYRKRYGRASEGQFRPPPWGFAYFRCGFKAFFAPFFRTKAVQLASIKANLALCTISISVICAHRPQSIRKSDLSRRVWNRSDGSLDLVLSRRFEGKTPLPRAFVLYYACLICLLSISPIIGKVKADVGCTLFLYIRDHFISIRGG